MFNERELDKPFTDVFGDRKVINFNFIRSRVPPECKDLL